MGEKPYIFRGGIVIDQDISRVIGLYSVEYSFLFYSRINCLLFVCCRHWLYKERGCKREENIYAKRCPFYTLVPISETIRYLPVFYNSVDQARQTAKSAHGPFVSPAPFEKKLPHRSAKKSPHSKKIAQGKKVYSQRIACSAEGIVLGIIIWIFCFG